MFHGELMIVDGEEAVEETFSLRLNTSQKHQLFFCCSMSKIQGVSVLTGFPPTEVKGTVTFLQNVRRREHSDMGEFAAVASLLFYILSYLVYCSLCTLTSSIILASSHPYNPSHKSFLSIIGSCALAL